MQEAQVCRRAPRTRSIFMTFAAILVAVALFALEATTPVQGAPRGPGGSSRAAGSKFASMLPADTIGFVEVSDVWGVVSAFKGFKFIDSTKLDTSKLHQKIVDGIVDEMEMSDEDAKSFLSSVEAASIAGRVIEPTEENYDGVEGVVLAKFSSTTSIEKLLGSDKFKATGACGKSGQYYTPADELDEDMEDDYDSGERVAWFKNQGVLVGGTKGLVESVGKVVDGESSALSGSPAYLAALNDYRPSSLILGFVNTAIFEKLPEVGPVMGKIFGSSLPGTFSVEGTPHGFKSTFTMRLAGEDLPAPEFSTKKVKLELADRMPQGTMYYQCMSANSDATGEQIVELIKKSVEDFIADLREGQEADFMADDVEEIYQEIMGQIEAVESQYGFKLADAWDAFDNQVAFGFVAPDNLMELMGGGPKAGANAAVVFTGHLGDVKAFDRLTGAAKKALTEQQIAVKETDDGWSCSLAPLPVEKLQVKKTGDRFIITAGGEAAVDKALTAFKGEGKTLADVPAFARARSTVQAEANSHLWFDAGRALEAGKMMLPPEAVKEMEEEGGINVDALKVSGDDRLTIMAATSMDIRAGVWTVKFESTNLVTALVGAGAVFLSSSGTADFD